jgi:hypothetical protein
MFHTLTLNSAINLKTLSHTEGKFSTVCWLTGRTISQALSAAGDPTPVGLMESCWGGTELIFLQRFALKDTIASMPDRIKDDLLVMCCYHHSLTSFHCN